LCIRPLPEDDPVDSDILAAAGTEGEIGKNSAVRLMVSYINGCPKALFCVVFLFLFLMRHERSAF